MVRQPTWVAARVGGTGHEAQRTQKALGMVIFGVVLRIQPAQFLGVRPGENSFAGLSSIALVPKAVVQTEAKIDAMGPLSESAPTQAFAVTSAKDPPAAKAVLFKVAIVLHKGLCFRHVFKRQIPGPLKDAGICVEGMEVIAVSGFPGSEKEFVVLRLHYLSMRRMRRLPASFWASIMSFMRFWNLDVFPLALFAWSLA